jgi:hypothetical protein
MVQLVQLVLLDQLVQLVIQVQLVRQALVQMLYQ